MFGSMPPMGQMPQMKSAPQSMAPPLPPSMQTRVGGGIGDFARRMPPQGMMQNNPWMNGTKGGQMPQGLMQQFGQMSAQPAPSQSFMQQQAPQGGMMGQMGLTPTAGGPMAGMGNPMPAPTGAYDQFMQQQQLMSGAPTGFSAPQSAPQTMAQGGQVQSDFDDYLMRLRAMR